MRLLDSNYFDLMSLPRAFSIDEVLLEARYRDLVTAVHPDRFVTDSPEQRRLAMQAAALANEAWRCLRDPVSRAGYLCRLAGVDVDIEARSAASADFLGEQMAWREALDEARLAGERQALEELLVTVREARSRLLAELEHQLDQHGDCKTAAVSVGQLMFVDRFEEQVDDALHDLS